jgi:hypothetical protein
MHDADITFVVQGPVHRKFGHDGTSEVLISIRRWYPNSRIVLSTFTTTESQLLLDLDYDELVLSEDPGDLTPPGHKRLNINRQIITSRAGLRATDTSFAIKTRTDLIFTGRELIESFSTWGGDNRILVTNFTTRDPDLGVRIPFWICDFLYMGRTVDLRFLFDVELFSHGDFNYFGNTSDRSRYCPNVISAFPPEVYLGLRMLLLFHPDAPRLSDVREVETFPTAKFWDFLTDYVVLVDLPHAGIRSIKYQLPFPNGSAMVSHKKWLAMRVLRGSVFERPGRKFLSVMSRTRYRLQRIASKMMGLFIHQING